MKKLVRMKNVKFRGKIPSLDFAIKTQIPRLGLKFHGPQKTVGPCDDFINKHFDGAIDYNIVIRFGNSFISEDIDQPQRSSS